MCQPAPGAVGPDDTSPPTWLVGRPLRMRCRCLCGGPPATGSTCIAGTGGREIHTTRIVFQCGVSSPPFVDESRQRVVQRREHLSALGAEDAVARPDSGEVQRCSRTLLEKIAREPCQLGGLPR